MDCFVHGTLWARILSDLSIIYIMKSGVIYRALNHNPFFKALEGMYISQCVGTLQASFLEAVDHAKLTVQSSIIHLEFSQSLSENPDP